MRDLLVPDRAHHAADVITRHPTSNGSLVLAACICVLAVDGLAPGGSGARSQDLLQPVPGACAIEEAYDSVFVGTAGTPVRRRVRVASDLQPETLPLVPFDVTRTFRGPTRSPAYLYAVPGIPRLRPGGTYVVFAERLGGRGDVLRLVRFERADRAAATLRLLELAAVGATEAVVYGRLVQGNVHDSRQPAVPLPEVTIRLSSDTYATEVVTASDGTYVASGFEEGLVWVEPQLPDGLWAPRRGVRAAPGACVAHHITAAVNGRVRGRVLQDDGSPYTWFVDLVPVDPAQLPRHTEVRAAANGEFEFLGQQPGDYLLGVNLRERQYAYEATTYFPGTPRREEALAITLGSATLREGLEWRLGPPVPRGEVLVHVDSPGIVRSRAVCVSGSLGPSDVTGGRYEVAADATVVRVPVLEGRPYRLVAHAESDAGHTESLVAEVRGSAMRQALTLRADRPAAPHPESDECRAYPRW